MMVFQDCAQEQKKEAQPKVDREPGHVKRHVQKS